MVTVLSPIWLEIPETARRLLQRIGAVLDFAHIKGWRAEEASLRSVRKGLPRQTAKAVHLEAMPFAEVPALMAQLAAASPTTGRDALRFTIYNAVRSNETRFAVWRIRSGKSGLDHTRRTYEGAGNPCRAAVATRRGTAAQAME